MKKSNISFCLSVIILTITLLFLLGAAVASYKSEKENRQISYREYLSITINLPIIFTKNVYVKIKQEFENTEPFLERCAAGCKRNKENK